MNTTKMVESGSDGTQTYGMLLSFLSLINLSIVSFCSSVQMMNFSFLLSLLSLEDHFGLTSLLWFLLLPNGALWVISILSKVLLKLKGGGNWDIGMRDFKECLSVISADDIHATGPLFTWWDGQDANSTHKKLD